LKVESFLAKKGDILIWHADLAHGGAPVSNKALTRQSLIGHFCPLTVRPHYFDFRPFHHFKREHHGLYYASEHYNLATHGIRQPWARAFFTRGKNALRRRLGFG